jgi:hypothetical protein
VQKLDADAIGALQTRAAHASSVLDGSVLPGTWDAIAPDGKPFGQDGNCNGTRNPDEPADGIKAQGRYMCYLVGQMGAGVTWQTLLWAYNAGPEATKAAGGRAPTAEAEQYARLILTDLLPKYQP